MVVDCVVTGISTGTNAIELSTLLSHSRSFFSDDSIEDFDLKKIETMYQENLRDKF